MTKQRTKEDIIREYRCLILKYLDAIEELQAIGCSEHEAESIINQEQEQSLKGE
jgi:hypothetical protein